MEYGLIIAKAVTSILLVVHFARMYFSSYKVNMQERSATYYELFRPFFLIIAIVSYSYIVDTIDSVAVESERYIYSNFKAETTVEKDLMGLKPTEDKANDNKESDSLTGSMTEDISSIAILLKHPSLLFVKFMDFIMAMLDSLVYSFVIILRFAFLFILRFLGPFALAFSIYHRFETWWVNWLKAYGVLYLWIIVIFLINFFAVSISHVAYKTTMATGLGDGLAMVSYNSVVWTMIIVKLYLYFKSKKLLYKIFA